MNTPALHQTETENDNARDRDSLVAGRPSWDVRLGLGGVLVAIVAAVTFASAAPASASPAQGTPAESAAIALVRGLHVFVSDPASAPLPAPEAVFVADCR